MIEKSFDKKTRLSNILKRLDESSKVHYLTQLLPNDQ